TRLIETVISFLYFFFSSRRRHTRSKRDWSSDVCSSDLFSCGNVPHVLCCTAIADVATLLHQLWHGLQPLLEPEDLLEADHAMGRSEERRVGKECRCRGGRERFKKETEIQT